MPPAARSSLCVRTGCTAAAARRAPQCAHAAELAGLSKSEAALRNSGARGRTTAVAWFSGRRAPTEYWSAASLPQLRGAGTGPRAGADHGVHDRTGRTTDRGGSASPAEPPPSSVVFRGLRCVISGRTRAPRAVHTRTRLPRTAVPCCRATFHRLLSILRIVVTMRICSTSPSYHGSIGSAR